MVKKKIDVSEWDFSDWIWEEINRLEFELDGVRELCYEIREALELEDEKAEKYFKKLYRRIGDIWHEVARLLSEREKYEKYSWL